MPERNTEPLQMFPSLDSATYSALRASIERWGVLVPVAMDQHGRIIDGHHRSQIADEMGVDYPIITHDIESELDVEELARTLNMDRRHLEPEQRRELVAHLRSEGHSYRAIGEALNVGLGTVHRDAATVPSGTVQPDRIVGRDGKSRPAVMPDRNGHDSTQAEASLLEDAPQPPASVRSLTEEEVDLKANLVAGRTIVVNLRADGPHTTLVAWLKQEGLLTKVDRTSPWGNPFVMDADGTREEVIAAYVNHYLPHKPSLLDRFGDLKGKALGCWCAPEPCHGHVLAEKADEE